MDANRNTLVGLGDERFTQLANTTAVIFREQPLSFRALADRITQVVAALRSATISAGQRIAILDKNHQAHLELFLGAVQVGAVLAPLNYRLSQVELLYILKDCDAALLFVGAEFASVVDSLRAELPALRQIIYLDREDDQGYEAWLAAAPARLDADSVVTAADSQTVVLQMYTSGTTGHPKGALLTHVNLLGLFSQAHDGWCSWESAEVCLVPLPMFHIGGIGWALIALYAGATCVLLRDADPARLLAAIEQYQATKMLVVPALLGFLLSHPQRLQHSLRSLRHVVYGASPITPELQARALHDLGCDLVQLYGLTEVTGVMAFLNPQDHRAGAGLRAGRAAANVELRIVDENDQPLPPGQVGEIVCRSNQVMAGYYKQPESTAAALRNGWLHSGDAGYLDAQGYLYVVDRLKDMIVRGGENIYPAEVESVLGRHPAVAEAAVIGIPDETWGEVPLAFVVLQSSIPLAELIEFARTQLAGYKVPRKIELVQALPRNAAGKVLKRELRAPYWQGQTRQVH